MAADLMSWIFRNDNTLPRTAHHCLRPLRLQARFWPEDYALFEAIAIPHGEDLVWLDAVALGPQRLLVVCLEHGEGRLLAEAGRPEWRLRQGVFQQRFPNPRRRAAAQASALCRHLDLKPAWVTAVVGFTGAVVPDHGTFPQGVVTGQLRALLEEPAQTGPGWNPAKRTAVRAALAPLTRARQRRLARLVSGHR